MIASDSSGPKITG